MRYLLLPWILEQEGSDFQQIDQRWRPKNLLMLQQVRALLKDMQSKYEHLDAAREELATLERADQYIRRVNRMRIWLREAGFQWKADQLSFLGVVSKFYLDYGMILRFLRFDKTRNKFDKEQPAAAEVSSATPTHSGA